MDDGRRAVGGAVMWAAWMVMGWWGSAAVRVCLRGMRENDSWDSIMELERMEGR